MYRVLTAYHSRLEARPHLHAGDKLPPHDSTILTFLTLIVKKKNTERRFIQAPKGRGFHAEDFDEYVLRWRVKKCSDVAAKVELSHRITVPLSWLESGAQ